METAHLRKVGENVWCAGYGKGGARGYRRMTRASGNPDGAVLGDSEGSADDGDVGAAIHNEIFGSDHCPVELTLDI